MNFEVGDKLTHYSFRGGKLYIKEGVIKEVNSRWYSLRFVFEGGQMYPPREAKIGVVTHSGPSVWLRGRDDEFAKKLLIEYEKERIAELQEKIDERNRIIEVLEKSN